MSRAASLYLAAAALAGCANDGDTQIQPGEWGTLVSRSWSATPGSDIFRCRRIQVTQDLWVAGFRAIAPLGTHHTIVTVSPSAEPLGDYDCEVGTLDHQMLYASAIGTDELTFPPGVAMHVTAGQFINLNLHVLNASDSTLDATSGIEVKAMDPADVVHEADMMFAGTESIDVPSDGLPHDVHGGCDAPREWNVFTLWPHMHEFATHQKMVITPSSGAPRTVLDDEYAYSEQRNYPMPTMTVAEGTRIDVTCTYVNNSGAPVRYGDSSNQEMCFTGMYKYPAGGNLFECVE